MQAWIGRHAQTALASLGKLAESPLATVLTVLVIGVTLALPGALQVLVKNALTVSGGWQGATDFSMYLQPDIDRDAADQLGKLLASRADIAEVTLVDADEALEAFAENSGFGAALDALDNNPLPHALVVRPIASLSPEASALLKQELENLPEADIVQLDTEWVSRFQAMLQLVRRGILLAAGMLGLALLVVIGNTIRLDIQNRRDEIEIMQLVGASDGFIRRPFLYTGFWYGLAGGLAAVVLVAVATALLAGPVSALAGLYGGSWRLAGLDLRETGVLMAVGVGLGLAGSWLATARHMRRIEPK
ncbi:MAG: permease-like cell division protein FtsX [Pseudomonadota bacterium]